MLCVLLVFVRAQAGDRPEPETTPLYRIPRLSGITIGGEARLTIFPDVGHGVWPKAYENPAFYQWLLRKQR